MSAILRSGIPALNFRITANRKVVSAIAKGGSKVVRDGPSKIPIITTKLRGDPDTVPNLPNIAVAGLSGSGNAAEKEGTKFAIASRVCIFCTKHCPVSRQEYSVNGRRTSIIKPLYQCPFCDTKVRHDFLELHIKRNHPLANERTSCVGRTCSCLLCKRGSPLGFKTLFKEKSRKSFSAKNSCKELSKAKSCKDLSKATTSKHISTTYSCNDLMAASSWNGLSKANSSKNVSKATSNDHSKAKSYSNLLKVRSFANLSKAKSHMNLSAVPRKRPTYLPQRSKCSQCTKTFKTVREMFCHEQSHTTKFLYNCTECSMQFFYIDFLIEHSHIHAKERPFMCSDSDCKITFVDNYEFKEHIKTHAKEVKEHWCIYCGQTFSSSRSLFIHRRTHSNSKFTNA